MYSHILCPIDGTETSFNISRVAIQCAKEQRAELILLYVVNDRSLQRVSEISNKTRVDVLESFKQQGKKFFQAIRKANQQAMEELNVLEDILVGDPAEEILKYHQAKPIDLIIMPTKDSEHQSRFMLGHVTARVVEASKVPVLTIPIRGASE